MAFSFTPQQQQQQPQQPLFQSPFQQATPFQQSSPFQQQQQSPFQLQLQQPQPQLQQPQPPQPQLQQPQPQQPQQPQPQQPQPQQPQPQQQLYLLTNDKAPATYSTKWAELHPDSQKVLLQIEERILEYRDESQRLDQCSRLYDSSVSNNGFELDASSIVQELGGISVAMDRQTAILQELMTVVKDMLRNTEVAVRSFMMLQPRFLHQNKVAAASATATPQPLGATAAQTSSSQPAANTAMPVLDFYSGLPKKPSPFLHQTVARFEKYLSECRQWIEELEQLLLLDSEKNTFNPSSSLIQSLPKVMSNVHDFFVHVAAKVESIHQYIESMKTAYLADQRRRGDGNNPFLEADRRETAKQEAAARRIHPTLHLPVVSNPMSQVVGPITNSAAPGASTATTAPASVSASSGSGSLLFSTPSAATSSPLFSTPTTSAPVLSLLGTAASPQSSLFSSLPASTPALGISTPLFSSTPSSGVSTFSTPFATGAATGSGASFGTASKARAKSRTGRR